MDYSLVLAFRQGLWYCWNTAPMMIKSVATDETNG
jgi:hypothetical protein